MVPNLRPDEHHPHKWADPPQFDLVDERLSLEPGARLELIPIPIGDDGRRFAATVVEVSPASDRAAEQLIVDTDRGRRWGLARRYGWSSEVPGRSREMKAGGNEVTATALDDGERARWQVVVPGSER